MPIPIPEPMDNDRGGTHSDHADQAFEGSCPPAEWVTVRDLGNFVYCPRAGQLSVEREQADCGDDAPASRLDYQPLYEIGTIREEIRKHHEHFKKLALWGWTCVLLWLAYTLEVSPVSGTVIGVITIIVWGRIEMRIVASYLALRHGLYLYQSAVACHIDPRNVIAETKVNWWSMIRGGFDSVEPKTLLRDSSLRLAGRPFRILQKGEHRIPVIRIPRQDGRIFFQHVVRLAAYAHLISVCERSSPTCGAILFADSDEALLIPISAEIIEQSLRELRKLRKQMSAVARRGSMPPRPRNEECCHNCWFARLRRHIPGRSETVLRGGVMPVQRIDLGDGVPRHCDCGDRFAWHPPRATS